MPFTWLCNGKGWCSLVSRWVTSISLQKHIYVKAMRESSPLSTPQRTTVYVETPIRAPSWSRRWKHYHWSLNERCGHNMSRVWFCDSSLKFKDPNQHIDIIKWHDLGSVSSEWALPLTVGFSGQGGGRAAVNFLTANNHPDWLLLGGRVSLCVRERARVWRKKKSSSPPWHHMYFILCSKSIMRSARGIEKLLLAN